MVRMNDENKTPEMMLQIDHKRAQKEQNYRRAEAFLLWKLGPAYDDAHRFLRGSGMDWPSLFVEFCEKVEEALFARVEQIEKLHWDTELLKVNTHTIPTPFVYSDAKGTPDGTV